MHDFPADGEYVFKLGFYYSPTGPLFGLNQGKGPADRSRRQRRAGGAARYQSGDEARERRDQDASDQGSGRVRSGFRRRSSQKFDGPVEDEYRMVEQSLVDVSAGTVPGMTTLPHLHELSITGRPTSRAFRILPAGAGFSPAGPTGDDEIPCAKKIICRSGAPGVSAAGDGYRSRRAAEFLSSGPQSGELRYRESGRRCRR